MDGATTARLGAQLVRVPAVCTIYNGALHPPQAALARVGLMMVNDVILRTAFDRRVDAIELRAICTEPGDYANPIEPSDAGGCKIARAIARAVGAVSADARATGEWPPEQPVGHAAWIVLTAVRGQPSPSSVRPPLLRSSV